nr:hypothetical protein CFP56_38443 [Quercus suber]
MFRFHFLAAPLSPTSSYDHHKLQQLPPVPTTTKHRPYLRFRPPLGINCHWNDVLIGCALLRASTVERENAKSKGNVMHSLMS